MDSSFLTIVTSNPKARLCDGGIGFLKRQPYKKKALPGRFRAGLKLLSGE
jgi:hypothetical protein